MLVAAILMVASQSQPQAVPPLPPPVPRVFAPPAPPLPSPITTGAVRLQTDIPLISEDDYPEHALFDDQSGSTTFSLTVGTNGRGSACSVLTSSGFPQLDVTTCTLVRQRARFTPATRDGKPVESQWRSRVVWKLPDAGYVMIDPRASGKASIKPEPRDEFYDLELQIEAQREDPPGDLAASSFVLLDVDTVGAVMRCTLAGGNAAADVAARACPMFVGRKLFDPAFDDEGNAVPDRVRVKIRW